MLINYGTPTEPGTSAKGYICLFVDNTHPSRHVFYTDEAGIVETKIRASENYNASYDGDGKIGYTGEITINGVTYKNWKQFPLDGSQGTGWEKWLHSSGCGLTSTSIILSSIDSKYTPYYLYHYEHGREKEGAVKIQTYLKDAGVSYSIADSLESIRNGLSSNKQVIMCLKGNATINGVKWAGSSGHYVAILGISDDKKSVYISNPGSNPSKKNGWVSLDQFEDSIYYNHTYVIGS